jgi:hypothetical protein
MRAAAIIVLVATIAMLAVTDPHFSTAVSTVMFPF